MMKIKTSDSFFPTKFRPVTANTNKDQSKLDTAHSRSYKLMKKRSSTFEAGTKQTNQYQSVNIFKNNLFADEEFNYLKEKPIGGIEMFLKQHNKKSKTTTNCKLSSKVQTPENRKKEIQQERKVSTFQNRIQESPQKVQSKTVPQKQEILKSHHSYTPGVTLKTLKNNTQVRRTASTTFKYNRNPRYDSWVEKQTQNYQTKMSILNEIYYKKPLVELYGEKYFQFMLRNRFEDEPIAPAYIHQIKSDEQANTLMKDKFLAKLKKINSNVRNLQKLIVKGKHFSNEHELRENESNM